MLAEPPDDYALLLKRLGELGARCLQQALRPGVVIGISWGTAVHSVVSAMPTAAVPDATVVQLIGAVGHGDPLVDGAELGRWLAQKLHASFRFLSAPLLVEDEALAAALRRERTIEETLALAAVLDVAVDRHRHAAAGAIQPAARRLSQSQRDGVIDGERRGG